MAGFDDPAFYGDRWAAVYDDHHKQRVTTQMIMLDGQGMQLRPVAIRYSWPAELDLMAGQAGLRLTERHADWNRQPFTSASGGHVSVYQRARLA